MNSPALLEQWALPEKIDESDFSLKELNLLEYYV